MFRSSPFKNLTTPRKWLHEKNLETQRKKTGPIYTLALKAIEALFKQKVS